jgi:hypothetical protein
MQIILGIGASFAFGFVAKWLPETIHPGIAGYEKASRVSTAPKRRFVILNPLKSLKLLMSPVIVISVSIV